MGKYLNEIPSLIKILLISSNYLKSAQFLRAYDFKLIERTHINEGMREFLEYEKSLTYKEFPIKLRIWTIDNFTVISEIKKVIHDINALFLLFDLNDKNSLEFLQKEDLEKVLNIFEFSESIILIGINYDNTFITQIDRKEIIKKSLDLNVLYCFNVNLKNIEDLDEIFDKLIEDHILKIEFTSAELSKKTVINESFIDFKESGKISTETPLDTTKKSEKAPVLNLENTFSEIQEDVKQDLKIREEIIELSKQIKEDKIIDKIIQKSDEILTIKKPEGRRKCPICENVNKSMIHELDDKSKILLSYPKIFGRKFRCGLCKTEWREEYLN